jgi:nucleotide-binding universal stress UspA family protein
VKRLKVTAPSAVGAPDSSLGGSAPPLAWLAAARAAGAGRPSLGAATGRRRPGGQPSERVQRQADELADAGCDLLVVGAAGDQVAGLVVLAALLDLEPVQAVGTAAGQEWARLTTGGNGTACVARACTSATRTGGSRPSAAPAWPS